LCLHLRGEVNVGILLQHCAASRSRRSRHESLSIANTGGIYRNTYREISIRHVTGIQTPCVCPPPGRSPDTLCTSHADPRCTTAEIKPLKKGLQPNNERLCTLQLSLSLSLIAFFSNSPSPHDQLFRFRYVKSVLGQGSILLSLSASDLSPPPHTVSQSPEGGSSTQTSCVATTPSWKCPLLFCS
jgi:hypothetical protein